jgi:hypothetical protein
LFLRAIPFRNGVGDGMKFCQFSRPHYTKKMHFRDPLYNKMALLRPLYQKMAFLRTPYITKWHFGDPPRQQNGIFETPYKKCIFGTSLYKFSRFDPLYKNGKNLTPVYKMPKM